MQSLNTNLGFRVRIALCFVLAPIWTAAATNVLLITVDDMNCDSVGAFGSTVPGITPHIDRLAAEGMRFEYAHVTIAICRPTRAVWMTGRYPHRNGALGFDPIDPGVPTLPEALHAAGYHTGILAKTPHVVPTRRHAWDTMVHANQLGHGRSPRLYAEHTQSFIRGAREAGKPFFLMVNVADPHRPFAGSDQERELADRHAVEFPPPPKPFSPSDIPIPGFLPDLPQIRLELAEYYASVHRADGIVGRVLGALAESGRADDTLVMFLSDHGMPLPFAKTNCWLHSTRTPWIVRWPGRIKPAAHDTAHMVSGIDLAPTVLDALGMDNLDGADGRSFLPVLLGGQQEGREQVFTYINRTAARNEYPMRAVNSQRFGYIYNDWPDGETVFKNESQSGRTMNAMRWAAIADPHIKARVLHFLYRTREEFYDYRQDPDALHNLIDDGRYTDQIDHARKQLIRRMYKTDDPLADRYLSFLMHK